MTAPTKIVAQPTLAVGSKGIEYQPTKDSNLRIGNCDATPNEGAIHDAQADLNTLLAGRKIGAGGDVIPLKGDGKLGPRTELAVKEFQKTFMKMDPPTGVIDDSTRKAIATTKAATANAQSGYNAGATARPGAPIAVDVLQGVGVAQTQPGTIRAGTLQNTTQPSVVAAQAVQTASAPNTDGPPGLSRLPPRTTGLTDAQVTPFGSEWATGPAGNLLQKSSDGTWESISGSNFLKATANMGRPQREAAILKEALTGNVPDSSRQMRELSYPAVDASGNKHTVTVQVLPDYLAIGSNADSTRMPMDPISAQKIADATGCSLPTSKLVDQIYQGADVKLAMTNLPIENMMSNAKFAEHDKIVDGQLQKKLEDPALAAKLDGQQPVVAGDKKDLILSNKMHEHPGKVVIYGWQQANGVPIQGVSWVHENTYSDYSHGVRLVSGTVKVDGIEQPLSALLQDGNYAPLVSNEGVIGDPRFPG